MKRFFLPVFFLVFACSIHAQDLNITGKITDVEGIGLSDAIVKMMTLGLSDTSGSDGSYRISLSTGVLRGAVRQHDAPAFSNGRMSFELGRETPLACS